MSKCMPSATAIIGILTRIPLAVIIDSYHILAYLLRVYPALRQRRLRVPPLRISCPGTLYVNHAVILSVVLREHAHISRMPL